MADILSAARAKEGAVAMSPSIRRASRFQTFLGLLAVAALAGSLLAGALAVEGNGRSATILAAASVLVLALVLVLLTFASARGFRGTTRALERMHSQLAWDEHAAARRVDEVLDMERQRFSRLRGEVSAEHRAFLAQLRREVGPYIRSTDAMAKVAKEAQAEALTGMEHRMDAALDQVRGHLERLEQDLDRRLTTLQDSLPARAPRPPRPSKKEERADQIQVIRRQSPFGRVRVIADIPGLDPATLDQLQRLTVEDTEDLWWADTRILAEALRRPSADVRSWQVQAELLAIGSLSPPEAELLARAEVRSVSDLARMPPRELVDQVRFAERQGSGGAARTTHDQAERWIEAAKQHLAAVPAQADR